MKQVLTFGRYYRSLLNLRVVKVPISLSGFTCPNIDGRVARGGCIYCQNESFSPHAKETDHTKVRLHTESLSNPLLEQQLQEIDFQYREFLQIRPFREDQRYIIYFQAFTNTYAPLETLKTLYEYALGLPGVIGLSIGTRTDSVDEKVLDYLAELSEKYEIWVEFGVQSMDDAVLEKINRGHDSANIRWGIEKTKAYGLRVCAHLIYGLPDESREQMLDSLKETLALGVDSLKFHPLYVVDRTILSNEYRAGRFEPISLENYLDVLAGSFEILPEDIIIQRLSAGTDDESLLAPMWCQNKNRLMAAIRRKLSGVGWKLG